MPYDASPLSGKLSYDCITRLLFYTTLNIGHQRKVIILEATFGLLKGCHGSILGPELGSKNSQESLQDDIKSPLQLFSSTQLAGLFSVILWGEFTRRQFPRFTVLIMSREVRYPLLPV